MARIVLTGLLLAAIGVLGLALAVTEPAPSLPPAPAPVAADVTAARATVARLRSALAGEIEALQLTGADIDGALRLVARALPGLRAAVTPAPDEVRVALSLPVDLPGGRRWINLSASLPPFDDGPAAQALTVGRLPLPPAPTLAAARQAGRWLAPGLADLVFDRPRSLRIKGQTLVVTLRDGPRGEGNLARGVLGALRGAPLPPAEAIAADAAAIRAALAEGRLPAAGSALPHLRFAVDLARRSAAAGRSPADYWTAAILGLAQVCGGLDALPVPPTLFGDPAAAGGCDGVTLAGRTDTRKHVLVSAALRAASRPGFAAALGEFKELHDLQPGGTGFDLSDLAANAAGIALSDRVLSLPPGDWAGLSARLRTEADILPNLSALPPPMDAGSFATRFGALDSPAYRAALDAIAAGIAALPFHRPPAGP